MGWETRETSVGATGGLEGKKEFGDGYGGEAEDDAGTGIAAGDTPPSGEGTSRDQRVGGTRRAGLGTLRNSD